MEGKVKEIKTELVECIETRCKRQDGLLHEQRENIRSLKADRAQAGPVRPNEVGRWSDARGYMPSLRGGRDFGVSWPNTGPQYDCPGVRVEVCEWCE